MNLHIQEDRGQSPITGSTLSDGNDEIEGNYIIEGGMTRLLQNIEYFVKYDLSGIVALIAEKYPQNETLARKLFFLKSKF